MDPGQNSVTEQVSRSALAEFRLRAEGEPGSQKAAGRAWLGQLNSVRALRGCDCSP